MNKKAKKANVHNKKLRDCRIHFNDKGGNDAQKENSTLFITEGDSASGSITKARDPQVQAVFSLRGKPLNCFGMTKKIVAKVLRGDESELIAMSKKGQVIRVPADSIPSLGRDTQGVSVLISISIYLFTALLRPENEKSRESFSRSTRGKIP